MQSEISEKALERAGIEFIPEEGDRGPGVGAQAAPRQALA